MTKISIYTKNNKYTPSSYYRLYKYFCNRKDVIFNEQITDSEYKKYMPISKQPLTIKIWLEIKMLFRVYFALKKDLKNKVKYLIVSRRFVNRFMPLCFYRILKTMKKNGTTIYWDFDDHILLSKEVNQKAFDFLSEISSKIVVTSDYLKSYVKKEYKNKVVLLPTTDEDIFKKYTEDLKTQRLYNFEKQINIVWIGTSVNLKYLEPVIKVLNDIAPKLNKKIIVTCVCNKQVDLECNNISLRSIIWTREVAIQEVLNAHIGIMPLLNTNGAKGKGGFKLIQYLSGAVPIIGSNVGYNSLVCTSNVGVLLDDMCDPDKLYESINTITVSKETWLNYSQNSLNKWLKDFPFEKNQKFWNELVNGI